MATDPVWWTPACQQAVHLKQQAWRVWRQDPDSLQQKETFLASVTHCVHVLQHAQQQCKERASRKLSSGSLQDKQWWTAIKRAAGVSRQSDIPVLVDRSGHEHTTAREKAGCFAQYFAMKCSLGSNDFSASDQLPTMQLDASAPQITAIHFRPANVRRQLAALNPHKATGPDGISARVLKECHRELAEPAACLFSCCFKAGVQPTSWKLAHVSPIHKKSSKSIVSNYRPVSLLSILSKVMESIVNSQFVNFLERHRLLNTRQDGFRRGTGAADLLTVLQYE